jgi:hypothetical protein
VKYTHTQKDCSFGEGIVAGEKVAAIFSHNLEQNDFKIKVASFHNKYNREENYI